MRGGVGKAGSYRVSFLPKKIQRDIQHWVPYIETWLPINWLKLFHSFPVFAIWRMQPDSSLWERNRSLHTVPSLNVRSGIALVSQSLPDGSQCWIGIYLALGRDQREAWLLAKGDSETEEGGGCFPLHQIFKTVILSLRHLGSSSQFLQKQRASLVWKW